LQSNPPTGPKKQDDAAEDPLTALLQGQAPDSTLYWQKKLATPLAEICVKILTPAQYKRLMEGAHTRVRGSGLGGEQPPAAGGAGASAGGGVLAPAGLGSPLRKGLGLGLGGRGGGGGVSSPGAAAAAPAGPAVDEGAASGSAGGGRGSRGRGRGRGSAQASSPARGRGRGNASVTTSPTSPPGSGTKRKVEQGSMRSFFQQQERCLNCRSPMPSAGSSGGGLFGRALAAAAGGRGGGSSNAAPPALCAACRGIAGTWTLAELSALADLNRAEEAAARAAAACRRCHSGSQLLGPVLCLNGECPVLYVREGAARSEAAVWGRRLGRLEAAAAAGCVPFSW